MSERSNRWICITALAATTLGVVVGAVRWLGPAALVQFVEPVGRQAPIFVGVVGPQVLYFLVQGTLPGGRDPVWLMRPPNDGWALVLMQCMLCAVLAMFPARRGDPLNVLLSVPFALLSAWFAIDRMRRVQRYLAQQQST